MDHHDDHHHDEVEVELEGAFLVPLVDVWLVEDSYCCNDARREVEYRCRDEEEDEDSQSTLAHAVVQQGAVVVVAAYTIIAGGAVGSLR